MPEVIVEPEAEAQYARMDNSDRIRFAKHLKKMTGASPRKHLKKSRYIVEECGQGRIVCELIGNELHIWHMFATHKEYENWFRSSA